MRSQNHVIYTFARVTNTWRNQCSEDSDLQGPGRMVSALLPEHRLIAAISVFEGIRVGVIGHNIWTFGGFVSPFKKTGKSILCRESPVCFETVVP